jgi:hypothetical protein
MAEHGVINDMSEAIAPNGMPPVETTPRNSSEPLEQRVQRLEDAVATLQDTKRLEDRLADRITKRLKRESPQATPVSGEVLVAAGRQLLPAAMDMIRIQTDNAERRLLLPPVTGKQPWLLLDFYVEMRSIVRLYLDRRYRVTWMARVVPLAALFIVLFSWFFLSGIWIVGPVLDRVLLVVLAFFVYKVLSREVQLYRQALTHLVPLQQP